MANVQETIKPSGQHYSGTNRVPNIKQLVENLDKDKKKRDAEIDAQAAAARAKAGGGEVTEHTATKGTHGKNRRTVTDPVTGNQVTIDDMGGAMLESVEHPVLSVPNANLDRPTTVKTDASQSGEEYRHNQDVTAPPDPIAPGSTSDVPIHGEKTNVLFHPTPAVSYEPMYVALEARGTYVAGAIFVGIIVFGRLFGGRLLGLVPLAVCISSAVFLWVKALIREGRNTEWSSEQKRGETAVVNLIPESVEWLNSALALVWGLINPDMFVGVADTLEDVMQASVPGVVDNVKVNDISQGTNPLRVLSLRALPDVHVQDLKDELRKQNAAAKDEQTLLAEEEGGEFYNLEATVAYHSLPSGANVASKARNMGMQIVFYLGIKGLFGVPFPVWVELNGLVATVRLRVALTPDAPFVKTVSFTLMGLPKIDASCIPLVEKGANILNLPLISNFVNWAIAAAASMYVAPKSMTLDIGQMLEGDGIQKDTNALGVLFVRIHKAVGLSKQDARGSHGGGSDPYICVAFSKFGKPQYCTRVIQDNLNPIFNESAALLVTPDIIRADEQLSLELWDSDRSSADDVVGKVELSIQELIQQPGRFFPQTSRLAGIKADSTMPGELHWEVGFFGKTQFRRALRTDGKDPFMPAALQDKAELAETRVTTSALEEQVLCTPPDPLWPSGVLSVVVHQIVGLELENVKGSRGGKRKGGREYEPARPEAGELKEEQGKALPSSYCTIIINDELVYKTRTKVVSSKPIFEAGTERFIRDWRSAIATVTVRDARNRQHDPIIGVVPLKLSDLLLNSSQSTRWYPLDGGIGFGRARISVLFRSVELTLPPAEVSFGEVGTFEFLSDTITTHGYAPSSKVKIRMRTGGSSASVRADRCKRDGADGLVWDLVGSHGHHGASPTDSNASTVNVDAGERSKGHDHVRLPVQYRYRSPVFFEFHPVGRRRSKSAYASIWLQDLVDNAETDFDVPIWRCDNPLRLSQSYITEANCRDVPDLALEELGRLRFRGRFKAGTDLDHLRFVSDNDSRETIETWEACFAEGVRAEVVHAQVPDAVQQMHMESLMQGRDVLAAAPAEDKKKWLAHDGTDWTGAFGGVEARAEAEAEAGADDTGSAHHTHKRHDTIGSGIVAGTPESDGSAYSSSDDGDVADSEDDLHYSEIGSIAKRESGGASTGALTPAPSGVNARDADAVSMLAVKEGVVGAGGSDGEAGGGVSTAPMGSPSGSALPTPVVPSTPSRTSRTGPPVSGVLGATRGASLSSHTRSDGASSAGADADDGGSLASPRRMSSSSHNPITKLRDYKTRSRDLHRRHRGLMQWKPMRNMQFAKDEATFAMRRVLHVGKLSGRSPDIETEV